MNQQLKLGCLDHINIIPSGYPGEPQFLLLLDAPVEAAREQRACGGEEGGQRGQDSPHRGHGRPVG